MMLSLSLIAVKQDYSLDNDNGILRGVSKSGNPCFLVLIMGGMMNGEFWYYARRYINMQ